VSFDYIVVVSQKDKLNAQTSLLNTLSKAVDAEGTSFEIFRGVLGPHSSFDIDSYYKDAICGSHVLVG